MLILDLFSQQQTEDRRPQQGLTVNSVIVSVQRATWRLVWHMSIKIDTLARE